MFARTAEKLCGAVFFRSMCVAIAGAAACLGHVNAATAAPQAMKYVAQTQIVSIGEMTAILDASVLVCGNLANGRVTIWLETGEVIDLVAVAVGDLYFNSVENPNMLLLLLPELDRTARPEDFIRVSVSSVIDAGGNADPGRNTWDLVGSGVVGGPLSERITFMADGDWRESNERCQPHNFGQLQTDAYLESPRQLVKPLDGSDPFEFEALLSINADNTAVGFFDAPLSSGASVYETFFGAVLPSADDGVVFVTCSMLPGGSTLDDMLWVSSTPVADSNDAVDFQNMFLARVPPMVTINAVTYWELTSPEKSE